MKALPVLNRWHGRCLSLFAAMVLVVAPLSADELLMKDGSRLLGKVVKQEDGTLDFETSYAGTIKVKWDEVSELHAERAGTSHAGE